MTNRELLLNALDTFSEELSTAYKKANDSRIIEFQAAIQIQAWFRGIRLRCYLKFLNRCCIIIQKHWRGYLGRRQYRLLLSEAVHKLHADGYYNCATKIQSAWRGFYSRKYYFNFYARKVYLEAIQTIGNIVRDQLAEYEQECLNRVQVKKNGDKQAELWSWAKAHHFYISTIAQPGVYGSPKGASTEMLLRAVRSELAHEQMNRKAPGPGECVESSCRREAAILSEASPTMLKSISSEVLGGNLGVGRWHQSPVIQSLLGGPNFNPITKSRATQKEHVLNPVQDSMFRCVPTGAPT